MKKMKVILYMIATALLLAPLAGCGSGNYSGNSHNTYYRNDPWGYDRYYRSRVNHHHYRPGRPNRPSSPARPVHLPSRAR